MIGLGSRSCSHLLFRGQLALNEQTLDELQSEFGVDLKTKRRLSFRERAVQEQLVNVAHERWIEYVEVSFKGQAKDDQTYEIEFHYDVETPKRKPRVASEDHPKAASALGILEAINDQIQFECEAGFVYRDSSRQRLFPFKVQASESLEQGFDEVRGLTMVKLEEEEVLYTVTLESLDLEELSLHAFFNHSASFSEALPEEILRKAIDIKSRFLE